MAYVAQNLTDDELLKQQQGGQPATPQLTGDSGVLGEGGAAVAGAPQSGSALPQQGAPTHSGWTNLRSYLDANRDQAVGLAGQVAGNITKQGTEAQSAIDSGVSDYNAQLSKATPSNYQDTINQASANPTDFVKQPQNVEAFKNLKSGLFSGPTTFETQAGYGDLATKADNASNLNAGAGNRQQLIKDLNPNMGTGQVALNELLLNGEPTAAKTIAGAAQPFAGLKDYLGNATKTEDSARDAAIGKTAEAQKAVQDQFVTPQTQGLKTLQDQINQRSQGASMDFNKNQAIQDMQNFVNGKSAAEPTSDEEKVLFPNGKPQLANDQGLLDITRQSIAPWVAQLDRSYGPGAAESITQRMNQAAFNGNDWSQIAAQNGRDASQGGIPTELRDVYMKIKGQVDQLKTMKDPLTNLRQNHPDDWLEKYFPGTSQSSGNLSPTAITTPDEAAKMIALQNLLDTSGYFNPDDLAQAGTYKPATIGTWKGF